MTNVLSQLTPEQKAHLQQFPDDQKKLWLRNQYVIHQQNQQRIQQQQQHNKSPSRNSINNYYQSQNNLKNNQEKTSSKPKPNRNKFGQIKYGKAGTRTEAQKKLVKENYKQTFESFSDQDIVCFTDGACRYL